MPWVLLMLTMSLILNWVLWVQLNDVQRTLDYLREQRDLEFDSEFKKLVEDMS